MRRTSGVPPYQILQKQLPRFGNTSYQSSERWTKVFPPSKTWWNFLQLVGFEQLSWLQMGRHITFYTLQCPKKFLIPKRIDIIGNQLSLAVSDTMFRDFFAHHISSTSIIRCGHLAPAIAPPSRQSPKMEVWKMMFPFQWCGWFSKFRLFNTFKGVKQALRPSYSPHTFHQATFQFIVLNLLFSIGGHLCYSFLHLQTTLSTLSAFQSFLSYLKKKVDPQEESLPFPLGKEWWVLY